MQNIEIIYSKEEIEKIISLISKKASSSFVIFLHGNLGTGKTFFVSKFLEHLGVNDTITSPTFSIFNEYQINNKLFVYHYDLYRLKKAEELMFVDIDENLENGMLIIEWPELAQEYGITPNVEIFLSYIEDENKRHAEIIIH